jgi:uncharacterized metal-binding protein
MFWKVFIITFVSADNDSDVRSQLFGITTNTGCVWFPQTYIKRHATALKHLVRGPRVQCVYTGWNMCNRTYTLHDHVIVTIVQDMTLNQVNLKKLSLGTKIHLLIVLLE